MPVSAHAAVDASRRTEHAISFRFFVRAAAIANSVSSGSIRVSNGVQNQTVAADVRRL